MITVHVVYYKFNDRRSHEAGYTSVESAYKEMLLTSLPAIAYPKGTLHGLYCYDPRQKSDLELFKAQLEECK